MPRFLNILMILLLAQTASSGQIVLQSLDDAWHYADLHNITIANANFGLDKSIAVRKQSYMAFLPSAGANASFTDYPSLPVTLVPAFIFDQKAQPGDVRSVQFGQKYIYTGGVTAQLDVVNAQTWYNVRTARETELLNRASVANAKKLAYQQVASQYYDCLLSVVAEQIASRSMGIADSVVMSTNNKFDAGTVNMGNVDQAKLNAEKSRQTYILAQYQLRISRNTLKALLNMSSTDSLLIQDSLPEHSLPEGIGTFAEDPAISVADYQSRVDRAALRTSKAAIFPTLSFYYSNTLQNNNNLFEPIRGGTTFQASYYALRANWNIFTGGARWLQVQRSKINYLQSLAQLDNTRKQSAINDDNIVLNYHKSLELLRNAKNVMDLSFDNYQHISQRYNEGLSPIEDRLNAFDDYIRYQNQYLNSLSDLLVQLYQVRIRQQSFQ
jgi:outer membrane protein